MWKLTRYLVLASVATPLVVVAQTPDVVNTRVTYVIFTVRYIMGVLFVLATLIFLWGIIRYVIAGDSKNKEQAKGTITWGIIGLAIMASVWGITFVLVDYFGVGGQQIPSETGTHLSPVSPYNIPPPR